jgi:hypothetical protein
MKNIAEKRDTVYFHLSGNGIAHHTEAASGSPLFRIAAADIGELRTAPSTSAFRSLNA